MHTERRTHLELLWAIAVSLLIGSAASGADGDNLWDADGEEVGSGGLHVIASDEGGGAFVAWEGGAGIFVQLLDDTGTPQWTSATQLSTSATAGRPAIYAEAPYGATVAWEDTAGIYVQRVNYSGTPQWTPDPGGVQVATSGEVPLVVHFPISGSDPGALVAWGEAARAASVNGSGVVGAPGVNGIALGSSVRVPGYMRMITDDAGGAIVLWADFNKDIVAQRINAGLPWGGIPTVVSNDFRNEGPLDAVPDGAGGALISWSAIDLVTPEGQIRAQRISSSGVGQWAPNGIVLVDSDDVGGSTTSWTIYGLTSSIDTDGADGAIVAWNDWRNDPSALGNDDIYAQRVEAAGTRWTANGVLLPPFIVGSTAPGSQRFPETVSDGNGGAIVTYQDLGGNSWDISATRLDAYGTKLFSRYVFTDFNQDDLDQTEPRIVFDASGPSPVGAIIAWDDDRSGLDVRAQKVEISGPANDESADAEVVTVGPASGTVLGASQDGSSSCPGLNGGELDVWYVFTPPSSPGTLEVDTCGTNDLGGIDAGMDTVLSLHSGAPGTSANELACNDDWDVGGLPANQCAGTDGGVGLDSATSAAVSTTNPVWIRVSNYPGTPPDDIVLNIRFLPEPGSWPMLASGFAALAMMQRHRRHRSRTGEAAHEAS